MDRPDLKDKLKETGKKVINYPDPYISTVSSKDWLVNLVPDLRRQIRDYFKSLFPIIQWIGRYNMGWATGDLIAGITVGLVLVPQSMSYAKIANLAPQYGLYSSFVGVFIYCFFATSKDVSIGPVAVMSLETGKVITSIMNSHPGVWDAPTIATTLAFLCGFIVLGLGLLRLGWVVEFIPAPAVSGFMTGSALNIAIGQVPGLFGIANLLKQNVGVFHIDPKLVQALGPDLFVATVILLLEHISIAKSFGRVNGYRINPAQELIAIGVTNTVGTVFHAYPATGSFSRSALKAKSGVRTPLAGLVTGLVVIVALYGLTPAFFWIPNAGLSALIIHAVADLVASPAQSYSFWRVSPFEFFIFLAAVIVTVFSTIEIGIYTSIGASIVLLLIRMARPRATFLGRVVLQGEREQPSRDVYVPFATARDHETGQGIINPDVKVEPPSPGIIIYRFEESFLYPNSSYVMNVLMDRIKATTRRGQDYSSIPLMDRPWNDPGPSPKSAEDANESRKATLKAVVLDMSAVAHIDTTSVQNLIDTSRESGSFDNYLRKEIEKWVGEPVEFHFANILSPWIRRALVAGGFGMPISDRVIPTEVAPIFTHHLSAGRSVFEKFSNNSDTEANVPRKDFDDGRSNESRLEPILSTDTPFFHVDLESAVRSAEQILGKAVKNFNGRYRIATITMSEQENNTPPKPKVGSLKDRIAAFEKSAQSDNIPTQKPLPSRTKPGNVSWKPTPPSPKDDGDDEKTGEKKHSGMSADDAKESIAAGGSLKARMAAWQGNIQPSGGSLTGAPPPAPKPLRKPFVPRPPTPDEDEKEGASKQKEPVAVPHRRLDNWDPLAAISAAVSARQRSPSPPAQDERADGETAIETAVEEKDKDEEQDEAAKEHERRAALAARMARLGGARIGMAPPIIPKKPKPFVSADEEPVKSNSSAPVRVLPLPGGGTVQSNVETPTEVKETGSDTFRMITERTADDEMTSRAAPVFLSAETPATSEEYERKDASIADEASSSQTSLVSSRSGPGSIPLPALPRRAAPPRSKHSARSLKSDQPTQESEVVSTSEEKVSVDEISETLQDLSVTSPTNVPAHDNYEEGHQEVHESTDDKDDQAEEIESHHDEETVQGNDHHIDDVGVDEDEEDEEINEGGAGIENRGAEEEGAEEEGAEEEEAFSLHDEEDIPPPPPPPRRQQSSQSGGGSSREQLSLHDDLPLDEEDISPPPPPPPPRRQQSSQSGGGSSKEQSSFHDDISLGEEDIPPPPPRRQQSSQSGVGSSKESEATSQMVNSASTKEDKDFFQGAADELEDS
ncbi:hypothetical protein Clacol_006642 [Clathrus columnatus]|uniref:STAS domain-containing protein n=1 Tax=Clathrus columnatus TaxID=1419009 RepID=A0AAV5AKC8_9AGAM|nr:hypothetical protein Clacol_006642 [Clathrus columnatus]